MVEKAQTPYSGGVGSPTGNPTPQSGIDLGKVFNEAVNVAYVVDPNGLNIAFKFQGDGTVLVYNAGQVFTLPYIRKKI